MSRLSALAFTSLFASLTTGAATKALDTPPEPTFLEEHGFVAVEAEHFVAQTRTESRAWHLTSALSAPGIEPDADGPHVIGASGGAYLEILPDTRRTHYDPIIAGESFSNTGGAMAVLTYRVRFTTPGRYYVWVRCFSTGGEDNGLHVGINNTWPESGLRWQTVQKQHWAWDSRQRTDDVPRGEPFKLFLDVPAAGDHTIHFSMREDGFEFDRWIMTTNRELVPEGAGGPPSRVVTGRSSAPIAIPAGYTDPVVPMSDEHDGGGLAGPIGDFRPGGKVTLVLNGPLPDGPAADTAMRATFTHESGSPVVIVRGEHAGEGKWHATYIPDRDGQWYFSIDFRHGPDAAKNPERGTPVKLYHGLSGIFPVTERR